MGIPSQLGNLRATSLTMVAVLAVVMSMSLGRTGLSGSARLGTPGAVTEIAGRSASVAVIAYLATRVGDLMLHHPAIGDTLFVSALSAAIWMRRFGPVVQRLGATMALPFIGLLVVPVPVGVGTAHSLWPPVIAVIALVWVSLVDVVASRLGWRDTMQPAAPSTSRPPASNNPVPAGGIGRRPVLASTRMAVQLAVALELSFLLGRWLYPQHWPWLVLSCYLVCSGNRGRGDVVHKGILRLVGAGIGTAAATLIAGSFARGDRIAVVLIFVVLAMALFLRDRSYFFWAGGVTAALALLNGYYGIAGAAELVDRLGGLFLGALIGVLVSWWLLPIRSGDVFRRRTANALAALSDYLAALRTDPAKVPAAELAFEDRVADLEQVMPTFRFHHRTIGRVTHADVAHPADIICAVGDIRAALGPVHMQVVQVGIDERATRDLGQLARRVGMIRRRMAIADPQATRTEPHRGEPSDAAIVRLMTATDQLDRALTVELWRRHGGHRKPTQQARLSQRGSASSDGYTTEISVTAVEKSRRLLVMNRSAPTATAVARWAASIVRRR